MTTFLGDIIVVKHIGKNVKSNLLHIPETVRSKSGAIEAEVLHIGKLPSDLSSIFKRRKRRMVEKAHIKYLPHSDLQVGDKVLVIEQVGTRNRIPNEPDAIIMDSEDVIAKLE